MAPDHAATTGGGEPPLVPYRAVREALWDGDVVLFRSHGWFSAAIRWAGRSSYSHAALIVKLADRVMLAESRELRGCRLIPLSSALRTSSTLHVFRPSSTTPAQRAALVVAALDRLGQPYGWGSIVRMALGRLPLVGGILLRALRKVPGLGWLPSPKGYSEDDALPPGVNLVCSAYVATCWRMAGRDLVPNLADSSTEPGDLARSAALKPLGQLAPPSGLD